MQGPTTFTSSRGDRIHFHAWAAPEPKGLLVISHGLGEHIRRYDHLAAHFIKNQVSVVGHDWPGHGASSGKRGFASDLDQLFEILDQVIDMGQQLFPDVPVFLFGQSMGGNIALNYTLRREHSLTGTAVNAPWIRLAFEPGAIMVGLARMMGKLYPAFSQGNGLNPEDLSRDPVVVKEYSADPLVHDKITAGLGLALMESAEWLNNYDGQSPVSLLLTHGSSDKITSHDASEEFAARVQGDVTFKSWDGLYHETHNEPEQAEVLQYLTNWISGRM